MPLGVAEDSVPVTSVVASAHANGSAYVTLSGLFAGNRRPYVMKTSDFRRALDFHLNRPSSARERMGNCGAPTRRGAAVYRDGIRRVFLSE